MRILINRGLEATRHLPLLALGAIALLLVVDLVTYWALHQRPLASVDGVEIAVWAMLGGTAAVAGIRWAVMNNPRMRFLAAGSIALMIAFSVLHPWQNGQALDDAATREAANKRATHPAVVDHDSTDEEGARY